MDYSCESAKLISAWTCVAELDSADLSQVPLVGDVVSCSNNGKWMHPEEKREENNATWHNYSNQTGLSMSVNFIKNKSFKSTTKDGGGIFPSEDSSRRDTLDN